MDFKLTAGLIAQDKLGAWEASDRRTFLHIPEGQEGAWGFYNAETNDIYIVSGIYGGSFHRMGDSLAVQENSSS